MSIQDFSEKKIRNKILNKIKPTKIKKRSAHWKGYIFFDNILITKVKIPNSHDKVMKESKSKFIAQDLKLTDSEFNNLVNCPLKGPHYYKILEKFK